MNSHIPPHNINVGIVGLSQGVSHLAAFATIEHSTVFAVANHQNNWGRTTHTTVAIYKADNGATAYCTIPVTLPNFSNPTIARRFSAKGHGTMEYEQAEGFVRAIIEDHEPVIGPREAAASIVPLICGLQVAGNGGGMMEIPRLG